MNGGAVPASKEAGHHRPAPAFPANPSNPSALPSNKEQTIMTQRSKRARLVLAVAAAFGVGLLASAGDARAQVHGGHYDDYDDYDSYPDPRHTRDSHGGVTYDRDGDGVMDAGEWLTMRFDQNHDGVLDRRERALRDRYVYRNPSYRSLHHRDGVRMWSDYDARGRNHHSQRHLREHDQDGDGYLDRRELRDLRRHDDLEQVFAFYDRNGDGVLSPREMRRTPLRNLARAADHEGDGYLTWDELDHYLDEPEAHAPRHRRVLRRPAYPVQRRPVQRRPAYQYELRFGF